MRVPRISILMLLLVSIYYASPSMAETYYRQTKEGNDGTESLKDSVETNAETASDISKAEVIKVLLNMDRDLQSAGGFSYEESREDFTRYKHKFSSRETVVLDMKYDADRMSCFEKANLIRCIFMSGFRKEVLEWGDIEDRDFMFFQDEAIFKRVEDGRLVVVELCRDGCSRIGLRP